MSNRLHNFRKDDENSSSITLQDIADELGIAKSSVSRALSGRGRIGEKTRQKVLECVDRLKYRPNMMARGLATSRSFNLGVLLPGDSDYSDIPFFHKCLAGITAEAELNGYDVLTLISHGNSTEHLERVLLQNKVDGVIITRLLEDDSRIALLKEKGMPFIVIGSTDDDVIQVDTDNEDACRRFATELVRPDLKKFLFIGGPSDIMVNRARKSGFISAMSEKEVDGSCWKACMENRTLNDVGEALSQNREFGADCIICGDDMICSHVMTWLSRNRIEVPGNVKVASFYNSTLLEKYGSISAIEVNAPLVGKSAASILLHMLQGEDVMARNSVEYSLIYRDSTAI